jgi:hypothetical protein
MEKKKLNGVIKLIDKILDILRVTDEGDHMYDGFGMMGIFGGGWWMWIMMLAGIILIPYLTIWTYRDAQKNWGNATSWALIVFFTMGFGFIIYALIRTTDRPTFSTSKHSSPPHASQPSTAMYSPVNQHDIKPDINTEEISYCENCGASIAISDIFCFKCGKSI